MFSVGFSRSVFPTSSQIHGVTNQEGVSTTSFFCLCPNHFCFGLPVLTTSWENTQVFKNQETQLLRAVELTQAQQTDHMIMINPSVVRYPPPKFNSSPLKSYQNPIGKDRLPTTFFHGQAVKLRGGYSRRSWQDAAVMLSFVNLRLGSLFRSRNGVLSLVGGVGWT